MLESQVVHFNNCVSRLCDGAAVGLFELFEFIGLLELLGFVESVGIIEFNTVKG